MGGVEDDVVRVQDSCPGEAHLPSSPAAPSKDWRRLEKGGSPQGQGTHKSTLF